MIATRFEEITSDVVMVVEAVGAALMVLGGGAALVIALPKMFRVATRQLAYEELRRSLGQSILLGLEVLIVADIIQTILVEATPESVLVLGVIVVIRILLSFSLDVEIDGVWPWARLKTTRMVRQEPPPD